MYFFTDLVYGFGYLPRQTRHNEPIRTDKSSPVKGKKDISQNILLKIIIIYKIRFIRRKWAAPLP